MRCCGGCGDVSGCRQQSGPPAAHGRAGRRLSSPGLPRRRHCRPRLCTVHSTHIPGGVGWRGVTSTLASICSSAIGQLSRSLPRRAARLLERCAGPTGRPVYRCRQLRALTSVRNRSRSSGFPRKETGGSIPASGSFYDLRCDIRCVLTEPLLEDGDRDTKHKAADLAPLLR